MTCKDLFLQLFTSDITTTNSILVCVCVCLCVFLYSSILNVSSVCNDVLDIIEDKDQDLNEGIILETLYYSFISVFESITFYLQRQNSGSCITRKKTI